MRTLAGALAAIALGSSAVEPASESYAIAQCAVVQVGDSPRLYLARPDSGLEALDLRSGRLLWRTKQASVPIMVRADRLLALMPVPPGKDGWRLAVLNARSGKVLTTLPAWGQGSGVGVVGGALGSMTTMWSVSRAGWDYVVWRAVTTPFSPVLTPNPRPGVTRTGAARVDLERGTLVPVNEEFPIGDLAVHTDRQAGYSLGPFEIDGLTVRAAVVRDNPQSMRIVLRRTRGTTVLPDVELCHVPWNSAGVSVSADRRDVVGACQQRYQSRTSRYEYHLVVHSTATGARLGHVMSDAFPGTWLLWKDKLVFYVPERVVVEDLSLGKKQFERSLRTLRYLGPYPPRGAPARP